MLQYIFNISLVMSGFLSLLEIAVTGGVLSEQIAGEVLKAKLRGIIDDHKEQFPMIQQMNNIIKVLLDQQSLVSQLSSTALFSAKNWKFINDNMQAKKQMAKSIIEHFPDVKSIDYQFTVMNGINIGLTTVSVAYLLFKFFFGEKPGIQQLKTDAKAVMQDIRKLYRTANPQFLNEDGQFQETQSKNIEQMQQIISDGSEPEISQGAEGGKSKLEEYFQSGLRMLSVGLMIWSFVQGVKQLNELQATIDKQRKYFEDQGEFQKMEQGLIMLMVSLSSDVFNLLNASRARVNEVRSILLLNSFLMLNNRETFRAESEKFIDTKIGITEGVIDASRDLFQKVKDVKYNGSDKEEYKKKFTIILQAYRPYIKDHNPRPLLNSIAQLLTTQIGTLDIASKFILDNETFINRFTTKLSSLMIDRTQDIKAFNPQSETYKADMQDYDNTLLIELFSKYVDFIFPINNPPPVKEPKHIKDLNETDQKILCSFIATFTDFFYYDDPSGQSLFKLKLSQMKSDKTNQQFLNLTLSQDNTIPVPDKDTKDEEDYFRKPFLDNGKNLHPDYFDTSKFTLTQLHRYMKLKLITGYFQFNGKKYDAIVSYEGLLFQSYDVINKKPGPQFGIQRDLYNQKYQLLELLVKT